MDPMIEIELTASAVEYAKNKINDFWVFNKGYAKDAGFVKGLSL